jgi:Domain of unknown function (DUF6134)
MNVRVARILHGLLFALALNTTIPMAFASSDSVQQRWDFRVMLDDTPIGYHRVEISSEANATIVRTQANFAVTFLFITVYSYEHETREYWKDGCLVGINSTTDDNGDDYFINSSRQEDGLTLVTQDGSNTFDDCIRTFAYWDIELLKSDYLLNTQTGKYQPVSITDMGIGQLETGQEQVEARRYRLVCEDLTIDLWYTKDMRWLALESMTDSGAMLRYLPEKPPVSASGERS